MAQLSEQQKNQFHNHVNSYGFVKCDQCGFTYDESTKPLWKTGIIQQVIYQYPGTIIDQPDSDRLRAIILGCPDCEKITTFCGDKIQNIINAG